MNQQGDSVSGTEPRGQRLPYHAPRLVSLGSVESLVQGIALIGSDAGSDNDCAFF